MDNGDEKLDEKSEEYIINQRAWKLAKEVEAVMVGSEVRRDGELTITRVDGSILVKDFTDVFRNEFKERLDVIPVDFSTGDLNGPTLTFIAYPEKGWDEKVRKFYGQFAPATTLPEPKLRFVFLPGGGVLMEATLAYGLAMEMGLSERRIEQNVSGENQLSVHQYDMDKKKVDLDIAGLALAELNRRLKSLAKKSKIDEES